MPKPPEYIDAISELCYYLNVVFHLNDSAVLRYFINFERMIKERDEKSKIKIG